jgi:hypothetical protein
VSGVKLLPVHAALVEKLQRTHARAGVVGESAGIGAGQRHASDPVVD